MKFTKNLSELKPFNIAFTRIIDPYCYFPGFPTPQITDHGSQTTACKNVHHWTLATNLIHTFQYRILAFA
ncbi:hypothetical protein [Maricurvus nonylphenolicus]|uniref:hypothetical protein n=1 Tax=Maricurvus nonylphenolicus TaxID=1008307 RepID=UPI0036F28E37